MVVTDGRGLTEWVNPAFTAMCGYSFAELRGRKPGHLLQGPDTDPAALDRIRAAVTARRSCCETVVNYHRNGSRYLAEISITPILDERRPARVVCGEGTDPRGRLSNPPQGLQGGRPTKPKGSPQGRP